MKQQKFNVDSPSFTPAEHASTPVMASRLGTMSPQIANAAIFTPRLSDTSSKDSSEVSRGGPADWSGSKSIPEFVPSNFQQQTSYTAEYPSNIPMTDGAFAAYDDVAAYNGMSPQSSSAQINPYAADASSANGAAAAAAYYQQQQAAFQQPLPYHLYAAIGPHRDTLSSSQRHAHDFFLPEALRQELQKRNEATLQVLPNLNLPSSIEHYHTLVPLDIGQGKGSSTFGYNTWTYKAISSKDGLTYVIRRLEGFRLTNEKAVYSKQTWKGVVSASVVRLHDCFTTRAFGDSSLVFVTDYHPLSKTIAEQYLHPQYQRRATGAAVPEQILWTYAVQLASALNAIHSKGLAARVIIPSKILITGKNRLRLNACGMMDVIKFEDRNSLHALQQDDFKQVGQLLTAVATATITSNNPSKAQEVLAKSYSDKFRTFITSLTDPSATNGIRDTSAMMMYLTDHAFETMDQALHADDTLVSHLNQELENGRLVRLLAKLGTINERPEFGEPNSSWSEIGERYYLKLFRDYVFHQVSPQGNPVVDLGHIITTLNKLDAGSEEKITLTSRDEATIFVVTYKDIKRALESSFQELLQAQRRG